MRLESIDARHTDTVALVSGPLVLMALKPQQDAPVPNMTREELLAAKRVGQSEWQVRSSTGSVTMRPFTSLGDLPYTTYVKLT